VSEFHWLRFALSRRPPGLNRVLFVQSGVNSTALRTVKLSLALLIWLFRKTCTTRISGRSVNACQRTYTPRAALPPGRRAGLRFTPDCQRPSARSRHTEFTTGSAEACEGLSNLVSSRWHKRDRNGFVLPERTTINISHHGLFPRYPRRVLFASIGRKVRQAPNADHEFHRLFKYLLVA